MIYVVETFHTGGFELWFGMDNFSALDANEEAGQIMARDPEVMKEFARFTRYREPLGRKIMRPFE